ncbi:MAG: response regulator transcription factor [Oscillospiraceae bacterium]|nr:response regulator transcription factor [Oscillospiraceae bacterium]
MTSRIKTVIVESDPELLNQLKGLLGFYRQFDIVKVLDDISEAEAYLHEAAVDAVFINAEVGDPVCSPDGGFLLHELTEQMPDLLTVLYTQHNRVALWAMYIGATAVFTLPVDTIYFQHAIRRLLYLYDLLQYKRKATSTSAMIKTRGGYRMLQFHDILFIERANRKNRIVCTNGDEIPIANYSFDELSNVLDGSHFFRCYSSFIVNLEKIKHLQVDSKSRFYSLVLEGFDGEVILSREKYRELTDLLRRRSNLEL